MSIVDVDYVIGVDEVGRGCWLGDLCVAAVITKADFAFQLTNDLRLADSKKLNATKRELISEHLQELAKQQLIAYSFALISPSKIDELNVLQATMLAMEQAISAALLLAKNNTWRVKEIIVDGNKIPKVNFPNIRAQVKGDSTIPAISAAGILAKVKRDKMCLDYDRLYPNYHISKHKGYGTKLHQEAINAHGVLPIHRKSFAPIKQVLTTG